MKRIVFSRGGGTRPAPRRSAPGARLCAIVCTLGIIGVAGPLWGPSVAMSQQTREETPSPAQIAQWVRELDDSRFVARRNATERLIAAGPAAIEPLAQTLPGSSLEVATRGIYVLKSLALSKDIVTQDAAADVLQQLATSASRSAARQAAAALATLGELRQQRAIRELEELGARISINNQMLVFAPVVGLSVEIGPDWQGTAADLQRFRWLTDVQSVSFIGQQITDEWVQHVVHLTGVERVLVKHAQISNEAVRSIAQLKRITTVELMYTPVDDAALEHLKGMKTVREVNLFGTNVTPDGARQYELAASNVRVTYKMGAFLGVRCQEPPLACQVVQVVADSAAANGGIEVLDVIVRYAGQPIANFDDLREQIGKNKVGDSVLIQVVRGAEPVTGVVEQRGNLDLGLEVAPLSFGCKVQRLSKDGAAAKAGLRVGDVIMELNGQYVTSSDELSKVIAPLGADAPLEFRGLRGPSSTRLLSRRVTFGEWTESR